MIITISVRLPDDATIDGNAMRLYDTLQDISPGECRTYVQFKVDDMDDNASFAVHRPE